MATHRSEQPAFRTAVTPTVMVCDRAEERRPTIRSAIEGQGFELLECNSADTFLEAVISARPHVLVYGLPPGGRADLRLLQVLKRAAPDLCIVLVAADDSLETQRLAQDVRPAYYAVRPVEPAELRDAVRDAYARARRPWNSSQGRAP